jgi:hypothetical protein
MIMENEGMQQRVSDMFRGISVDAESGEIEVTPTTEAQICQQKRIEYVIDRLVNEDDTMWDDYI